MWTDRARSKYYHVLVPAPVTILHTTTAPVAAISAMVSRVRLQVARTIVHRDCHPQRSCRTGEYLPSLDSLSFAY